MKSKKTLVRSTRSDGEKTKQKIISHALRLFAEKGFKGTTSKEICKASKVNEASVVYYFGSKEALYGEVLRVAHNEVISFNALQEIAKMKISPDRKLRKVFESIYEKEKTQKVDMALRIFLREVLNPSKMFAAKISDVLLPKMAIVLGLTSEISGLPIDSSELRRLTIFTFAPSVISKLFPHVVSNTIFGLDTSSEDKFVEALWQSGLRVLKGKKKPSSK